MLEIELLYICISCLPCHGSCFSWFGQDASQSQIHTAIKSVLLGLLFAYEKDIKEINA